MPNVTDLTYENGYAAGYKEAMLEAEKMIRNKVPAYIIYESDELLAILHELRIKGEQR